jgi:hypothetical protein
MNCDRIAAWLELPAADWPPDHYALLGLAPGESDVARVERSVNERMDKVRCYQLSFPDEATEAMNRLAQAWCCLSDPVAKRAYDANESRNASPPESSTYALAPDAELSNALRSLSGDEAASGPERTVAPSLPLKRRLETELPRGRRRNRIRRVIRGTRDSTFNRPALILLTMIYLAALAYWWMSNDKWSSASTEAAVVLVVYLGMFILSWWWKD